MKIKNIKAIAFLSNLEKAYTEGVYADTPANRKLGRVGMTYKEWTSKQQGNKESKEENNNGNNDIKSDKKDSLNLKRVKSYEDIPFNSKTESGYDSLSLNGMKLWENPIRLRNGKIKVDENNNPICGIYFTNSKGETTRLNEEDAVKVYNKYFIAKNKDKSQIKKEINDSEGISQTKKEINDAGISMDFEEFKKVYKERDTFDAQIPYKNPITNETEYLHLYRKNFDGNCGIQFTPEEGKSKYSAQYSLMNNKGDTDLNPKEAYKELKSTINYYLKEKIKQQSKNKNKETKLHTESYLKNQLENLHRKVKQGDYKNEADIKDKISHYSNLLKNGKYIDR